MKENKIKRFNENSELNISDVSDSEIKHDITDFLVIGGKILS
jgi:hypothetical protein